MQPKSARHFKSGLKIKKSLLTIGIIVLGAISGFSATPPLTKVWDKVIGNKGLDRLQCANPTNDGGFIICGLTENTTGFKHFVGYGGTDIWVIKLKSDKKTIEWQQIYGGINDEGTGGWDFPGSYIEQTTDGGYILGTSSKSGISGNKTSLNKGGTDYWIVKLDHSGNILWEKDFGGNHSDQLSIVHELDAGYIVGGSSDSPFGGDKNSNQYGGAGDTDYWVIRLDKSGNKIWDYSYGGKQGDYLTSMLVLKNTGHILLGGNSSSDQYTGNKTASNKGISDYWIAEIDDNGGMYWDQSYGGDNEEFLTDMDVDYKDPETGIALLLAGTSKSDISGDKTEKNRDISLQTDDIWIIKCDISGAVEWDKTYGVSYFDNVKDAKFMPDHNIIIGGNTSASYSWGGFEWGPGTDKSQPNIGNSGNTDIWVLKLKGSSGTKIWDRSIGTTGYDLCTAIYLTSANDFWIAGFTSEEYGFTSPNNDRSESLYGSIDFWISSWKQDINMQPVFGNPPVMQPAFKQGNQNTIEKPGLRVQVYPNPASSELNIETFVSRKGALDIQISDQSGKIIYSKREENIPGVYQQKIRIQNYPAGLYYLKITDATGEQTVKFLKE